MALFPDFFFQHRARFEAHREFGWYQLSLFGGRIDDDAFRLLLRFKTSEALHIDGVAIVQGISHDFYQARITKAEEFDLYGEIVVNS